MIIDVPTSAELIERADSLLHLSYSIVQKLHENQIGYENEIDDGYGDKVEPELVKEYWSKCSASVANAVALLQQSHELFLKGRIAEVSPYLLLAREPQHWPKSSHGQDTSFSEFLTVGAAELPNLHDAVCKERLTEEMQTLIEKIRKLRNKFIHQGRPPATSPSEFYQDALRTHKWAHPNQPWFEARELHLSNDHLSALFSSDHVIHNLHTEFETLWKELKPSPFAHLIGGNKRERHFFCPNCEYHTSDFGELMRTATLTETKDSIFCIVCRETTQIFIQTCFNPECKCDLYCKAGERWDETCRSCGAGEDYERRQAQFAKEERLSHLRRSQKCDHDPFEI